MPWELLHIKTMTRLQRVEHHNARPFGLDRPRGREMQGQTSTDTGTGTGVLQRRISSRIGSGKAIPVHRGAMPAIPAIEKRREKLSQAASRTQYSGRFHACLAACRTSKIPGELDVSNPRDDCFTCSSPVSRVGPPVGQSLC